MCLIVFAWRPTHALPLIVAANRDEFHARPSQPLGYWDDAPHIVAGRDLQAGGTWMGVGPAGRFAALTNIRAPGTPLGTRSRGELPERFLLGQLSPEAYLIELAGNLQHYSGFNLLVGDAHQLWYLNSHIGIPEQLSAGVYGLSNAALNTPWPKLVRARSALHECLGAPKADDLLRLLSDAQLAADADLPNTGVPYEWEKRLSSVFIACADYGTRASTALLRRADGSAEIIERRFGPAGALGESRISLPPLLG
ncbi:NRDE family protein [Pseudomonas sp. CBC3]|uniref:NRDE family protein n=1 Tax=Pseudomonas sp. CBC3 TaxID=3123318 RepID=UPI0030EAA9CA